MAVKKIKHHKPKPRPKPVIEYPPVPTKTWIPPDKRKKPPKPEPKYVKPEGISQKLAISTLKKVWNKFVVYGDSAIITGHFSQFHKRFSFKSNGYQGACNSATACAYAQLYKMALWTDYLLDEILIKGDDLYVSSTQQGDKCLIEVPPEKMHTSFFWKNYKITLFVNPNAKVTKELTSASEEKAKGIIIDAIHAFLSGNGLGIFYIKNKYAAIWTVDGVCYLFDPEEHDEFGNPWTGVPGHGLSFLGRFKTIPALVETLYKNFPNAKEPYAKFHLMPCGIARIVYVDTTPPETFEDLAPQDIVFSKIIEEPPPPPNIEQANLEMYVEEDKKPMDPAILKMQEISPLVNMDFPSDKRPSFVPEGPVDKNDVCRYAVPVPTYLKGENARLTYYTEIIPEKMGILRGSTCQTDQKFSKYLGRQSMGNALSALIMLRLCKAKHWVPKTVDTILKYGETLYRDAMISIPRTHSLRLSNFPEKIEYEGQKFTPEIDEYGVVGQMQSQDYDILDLEPALNEFLTDNDCCIILGPQILAVWIEDGVFYMFDPNERDPQGKAVIRTMMVGTNTVNIDAVTGTACVVWCQNLIDLVNLYVNNTEKARRDQRFYLSKVTIKDYVDVSEDWFNFKGINIGKWILRGNFNQTSLRFSPESRNFQGTANALMALAMSVLVDEKDWTSDVVDEILLSGDSLYLLSVGILQEKGLFSNPQLMLAELKKSQRLRDKEAYFELDDCVVNGLIYAMGANDTYDLRKGLELFFRDNEACVLTTRQISLPIWRKSGVYFYLDPYSRDEKGLATGYGRACVIRHLHLEDLADAIEANLEPYNEDFYNISKVKTSLYEAGSDGSAKPALNNYTAINDKSAILRSWLNEQSDKYEVRKGRQTVPMCISAMGFNKLKPSIEWTKNDMDIILDKGDVLYIDSMALAQKALDLNTPAPRAPGEVASIDIDAGGDAKIAPPLATSSPKASVTEGDAQEKKVEGSENVEDEEEEEEEEVEPPEVEVKIDSENVKLEFNIGPNNLKIGFTNAAEGNIRESLKDSLKSFFSEEQTDKNFNQEALLETKHYTVAMWRDDKAYYVFDPRPRDAQGEVIGKTDWDPEPPEPEPEPEPEEEAEEGAEKPDEEVVATSEPLEEDAPYEFESEPEETEGEAAEESEDTDQMATEEKAEEDETAPEEESEMEAEEEHVEEAPPPKPKKPLSYWLEQEKSGRACVVWFTNLDDFVNFIYENIPVKDRLKTDFVLKKVDVINDLRIKSKYNPEDEPIDVYSGDWYSFKELEHGKWIIRASLDLSHELFPASNRGKQGLTVSVVALGIWHSYDMTCFNESAPDSMIIYGDKLYTFMKRMRKKQLLDDPKTNLKEDEVDWLVQHEEFQITDIPKKICISQFMFEVYVTPTFIVGDIKAQDFEDILDVKKGLEQFFASNMYGILFCKGIYVAIWRGQRVFYMFDGMKRGPNGIQSTIGSGCLTRYLDMDDLADVFLQNLPLLGKNEFVIHKINLARNICPREREPKKVIPAPKAVSMSAALREVFPGKSIIRGTIHQEDPRFGKGPNVMSAPIAIVALTMSLIHKPETWSRPIIDDIIILGSELYEDSINALGFDFNPWEDKLDVYRVQTDFKLGVIKANCELRHTDQKGLIDVKQPGVQNLRQGMEHFFEENTHGILITEPLTLAVWEQKQEEGEPLIYVFDPSPRNATGMPLFSGTACVLAFVNAKMASDHIISCILDPVLRVGEFKIVPVEIVVGRGRTVRKIPEKSPTRSSINILPRCSKQVASEQKKKLRLMAEEERKRKEAKKQQMIGRNGYHLKGAEAILRGYKSQNSEYYDPESRNKQDIPNCIASVVMHSLLPIEDWNYRHIDLILDTGDLLYIDSYIVYGPKDPKLGMENILRKFLISNLEVHVTIYKPIITEVFTPSKLTTILEAFFQQETVCILNYSRQWVSVFFKSGYYYMFDPHERDIDGNLRRDEKPGTAVVVRFDNLNSMALKIVNNLGGNTEEAETFSLWILSVESK